ncbi:MAG: c-type cytochrome [Pseudomonadota bacterium]
MSNVGVRVLLGLLTLVWTGGVLAGDPSAGKSLFPVCTACHGPTGQGNQAMNAPKLAGQDGWYLIRQMELFQMDARGTAPGDMQGMQMGAMSKGPQLKGEGALQNLAAYIDTFPDKPPPITVQGDAEAGKPLYLVCSACHGDKAQGNEAMAGPRLAGQNDWYLVRQIEKFKKGQRGYHNADHGGRQMRPMVAALGSEEAVNNVVAYINSLVER